MEELEDDPSSEMLAIELYRPAVFAARTFDSPPHCVYAGTVLGAAG